MDRELAAFVARAEKHDLIEFVLRAIRAVLPILAGKPEIHQRTRTAVADVEAWQAVRSTSASQIHEHIHPLALLDDHVSPESREDYALFCVINGLYYLAWEVDNIETLEGEGEQVAHLAADTADVGRHTARDCVVDALEALDDPLILDPKRRE